MPRLQGIKERSVFHSSRTATAAEITLTGQQLQEADGFQCPSAIHGFQIYASGGAS